MKIRFFLIHKKYSLAPSCMQRHKIRLDVVLAGVVLLLLFSLLPFFFQRQIIEEPGTDLRYHHKRPIVDRVEAEEEIEEEEIEERMANIIVAKASEFDETLREYFVKHAGDTVLVYLYGNVQPQTGKSVRLRCIIFCYLLF
jgi:hypothetical protein